jgi:hypothetical protein
MKIHEIPPKTKKKNIQKAISHIIFHPIFESHEVSTSQPPMDPMDRVSPATSPGSSSVPLALAGRRRPRTWSFLGGVP